jgi:hypothetical protein
MDNGRDGDNGDQNGWDLFGSHGFEAVAGLVGDGRDSAYVRGVDYTAAVRRAKSGERMLLRALRRALPLGVRVVTQSWCTEDGEPVVRVEMSAEAWRRWVLRLEVAEQCVQACADSPGVVREVVRAQAFFTPGLRRAWARRPASMMAASLHQPRRR